MEAQAAARRVAKLTFSWQTDGANGHPVAGQPTTAEIRTACQRNAITIADDTHRK